MFFYSKIQINISKKKYILPIASYIFLWYKIYKGGYPMNNNNDDEKKEIEVVNGDGKELNISPVYEHIKSDIVPDNGNKRKDIVIPKSSSDKK